MAEQDDKVKITMVGGKNVGKTCFMHGMYAVVRRGVQNFFLHASDVDEDNRLIQGWDLLTQKGPARKWPVPTSAAVSRYQFTFKRGLSRPIMEFEWIDYRGGALLEDSDNAKELIDQLLDSDCLFFCVDGGELREPVNQRILEIDQKMCISRAKVLLEKLAHRIPIAVLITKHDLCQDRPHRELIKDVERLFDSWLVPGEGWEVMICPVSLGSELAKDRANGAIDPQNLHLPLIYAIFSIMVSRLVRKEREVKRSAAAHQAAMKRTEELGRNVLLELWNRNEIENARKASHDLARERSTIERDIVELRRDVALLGRELGKALLYSDGERVIVG